MHCESHLGLHYVSAHVGQPNLKATASTSCCQRGTTFTGCNNFQIFDALNVRRHQNFAEVFHLLSQLRCCACATGCTEIRGLLTEQALLLSEGSLFSNLLPLPVKSALLLGCCLVAGSGYYRCELSFLPRALTKKAVQRLLRSAQLPGQGSVLSLLALQQYW